MCRTTARSCEMNRYATPNRLLQVLQQIHHLRADRYVQRRHRLISNDQPWPRRQRSRNRNTLTLAAREFERVATPMRHIQPDQAQQLDHALAPLRPRRAYAIHVERFGDDVLDDSGAGSVRSTGPGTRSASHVACVAARGGRERADSRLRIGRCPTSARSDAAAFARWWTCRSRIRRPAPASLRQQDRTIRHPPPAHGRSCGCPQDHR